MAFLLPTPQDGRPYRDDDHLTVGRPPHAQRSSNKASPTDGMATPSELHILDGSGELKPQIQLLPRRKHVVIADPVAFRSDTAAFPYRLPPTHTKVSKTGISKTIAA